MIRTTLPKTNFNFSVTFIWLSASDFSLDQSKNLWFGKELIVILREQFIGRIITKQSRMQNHPHEISRNWATSNNFNKTKSGGIFSF